jgi:neutral trehalase
LKESQLAGIIFRFLSNLFQHPNHEYLFERIDYLLTEAREYENHIDNKFRILEKSIGEYLNQAHAVFNIDDETEQGKSIKQSDSHKGEEMQQRQIKSPIDAL